MKIPLSFNQTILVLSCVLFSAAASCDAPAKNQLTSSPVLESYEGTGRACAGKLIVSEKTLSWMTPFSQCKSQSFQQVDSQENPEVKTRVLKIAKPAGKCLYEYVVIENKIKKDVIQVTGYKTLEDQQAHKLDEALSCVVISDK